MRDLPLNRAILAPLVMLALLPWFMAAGCARTCYRQRADADAYRLIETYNCDPRWELPDYTIDISPESRMFDPNSPDHPPMPPDDPAAHSLMHNVDCKRGYPHWHANGDIPYVENPGWLAALPRDSQGRIVIDANEAVRLALLHSSDYQQQLEELYLSALDVSFERFRFDTQFFGGFSTFFTADGRLRSGTGESSSTLGLATFPSGTNISARRLFSTGGELVVGMANSILWQFAGPDTQTATTLLDFSLVQPLLRLGGRDQVMERLTIAERSLLANVRQMERYREGYYVQIVTGRFGPQGPTRRGGFFGGSGLEGFSGIGGGGFGRVGAFGAGFFGNNFGFAGGAGAGLAGGYLGLLQSQQAIRNQRATIASLRSSVSQLDSFFRAGRIDYFQVELARQALINTQSQLLNAEQAFQTSLDQFKTDIGLPPQIELTLDESLVEPFELIESELVDVQNQVTELQESTGKIIVEILAHTRSREEAPAPGPDDQSEDSAAAKVSRVDHRQALTSRDPGSTAARRPGLVPPIRLVAAQENFVELAWSPALGEQLQILQGELQKASEIRRAVADTTVRRVRADVAALQSALDQRLTNLDRLREHIYPRLRENLSSGRRGEDSDESAASTECPAPKDSDEASDVTGTDRVLSANDSSPTPSEVVPVQEDELRQLPEQLLETLADVELVFEELENRIRGVEQELAAVLAEGPRLPAGQLGLRLRDDVLLRIPNLLNELAANILSLTLVQARARTESVSLLPINMTWQNALAIARRNRLDWMNARASLVDAWRLVQFNSDSLESGLDLVFSGDISNTGDNPFRLRSSTGRLRIGFQFDAPITRLAQRNQYRQALIEYQQARRAYYEFEDDVTSSLRSTLRSLDVNQLNFEYRRVAVQVAIAQVELARLRLQEPPRPEVEFQFSSTTARDLVSALSDLLVVQNDFLSVWTNQEVLRRVLDLDLGTMQLDRYGLWVDPGPILDGTASEAAPCQNGVELLPSIELDPNRGTLPTPKAGEESSTRPLPEELRLIDPANGLGTSRVSSPLTAAAVGTGKQLPTATVVRLPASR